MSSAPLACVIIFVLVSTHRHRCLTWLVCHDLIHLSKRFFIIFLLLEISTEICYSVAITMRGRNCMLCVLSNELILLVRGG